MSDQCSPIGQGTINEMQVEINALTNENAALTAENERLRKALEVADKFLRKLKQKTGNSEACGAAITLRLMCYALSEPKTKGE